MFKPDLEKAEEPEIKLPTSFGSSKKQESSRKTSASALLITPKPLTVWITTNCGKFFHRNTKPPDLPPEKSVYAGQEATDRTRHGTTDWFLIGKGISQGCILSLHLFKLYAEYIMRNPDWMKHKLESRLSAVISMTSDTQMTPPLWQKVKRN